MGVGMRTSTSHRTHILRRITIPTTDHHLRMLHPNHVLVFVFFSSLSNLTAHGPLLRRTAAVDISVGLRSKLCASEEHGRSRCQHWCVIVDCQSTGKHYYPRTVRP